MSRGFLIQSISPLQNRKIFFHSFCFFKKDVYSMKVFEGETWLKFGEKPLEFVTGAKKFYFHVVSFTES